MEFPNESEVAAGIAAFNRSLADVWSFKQREIEARLNRAAQDLVEDRIREVEPLELDFQNPPELAFEDHVATPGLMKAVFATPGDGSWNLTLRARVKLGFPFLSRRGHLVKVKVRGLRARAELHIDRRSPIDASLLETRVTADLDDVRISASNFLLRIFTGFLSFLLETLEGAVERQIRDALADVLPAAAGVRAIENLRLAAEPVRFSAPARPLEELEPQARAVSERIERRHTPFGTVLNTLVAKADPDGPAAGYIHFEDSSIWTGHWLAAEVYRHRSSGDAAALENIRRGLGGLERLIRLTEDPGQLSRVAVPLTETEIVAALDAERIERGQGDRLFTSVDGKFRSIGHITRDQYIGAFLGSGLAALWIDDEDLRQQARGIALEMAEYLISQRFCPTEAEPDPDAGFKPTSVTYVLHPTQRLAILQLAKRLDPRKYSDAFEDFFPVWSVQWFFQWLPSLDPHDSYFKFNLMHTAALLLLELEDDPDRRAKLAQSFRAVRRILRYHANAYFNLVELETLDEDELSRPREQIEEETRQLISQAFERPEFIEKVDLSSAAGLDIVDFRGASPAALESEPEKVSRQPVEVPKRPGADFLWQRSPLSLRVVWNHLPVDPAMRSPGVDLVLAYWMARKILSP